MEMPIIVGVGKIAAIKTKKTITEKIQMDLDSKFCPMVLNFEMSHA